MALTLPSGRLTTRLAAPARDLANRLGRLALGSGRTAARDAAGLPVARRLHIALLPAAPEDAVCAALVASHAELAAQERWDDLLAALTRADQNRAAAPGGRRLAALISEGARAGLAQAIAHADFPAAEAGLDRLSAVSAAHPESYAAAQILAQAHLDLGWARRAAVTDHETGRSQWHGFLSHTAEAERILDPFDPIAESSPLLAATRYHLVRGLEDGERLFRDWYEDWSDLDPTCPEPHAAHAVHLLPNWYGTLAGFDDEARAAMGRTRDVAGASAYAVFYMSAIKALGSAPPGMDIELYLKGLLDYHHATGCQYRANVAAAAIARLGRVLTTELQPGAIRTRMAMEVLEDHMTEALREFHLSAWDRGEAGIHWALGEIFREPLARGDHIFLGPEGIETRPA
jgi:hypothetical protein